MATDLVDFDLPPLDDSNSIVLPNESPLMMASPLKSLAATKTEQVMTTQDSTSTSSLSSSSSSPPPLVAHDEAKEEKTSLSIVLLRSEQGARLPNACTFDFPDSKKEITSSVHWLPLDKHVPIYSVHDYRMLVQTSPLIPPTNLMARIDTTDDCPVPCLLLSNAQISDAESVQNWKNALADAAPVPIHSLATKFSTLFDATHDGTPKIDLATSLSSNAVDRMTDGVLSSTRESLSPHCYESAVAENPLLNALATTALSDSWLDVSPDFFIRIIDMVVCRYRNTLPALKDPLKSGSFANFCVEDTTASTASFSASLPATVDKAQLGYFRWDSALYYYNYFSSNVAGALVSNFTGKPFLVDDAEDEKAKTLLHVESPSQEKKMAAVNISLASQPSVHIVSNYDSAKSLSALHHSFIHPDSSATHSSTFISQTLAESHATNAILNEPAADFVAKSSTLSKTFDMIAQLDLKRNEPTADLKELVQNADDVTFEFPCPLTKDVFHITKVVTSGHFTEWRTLLNRVKEQYFRSPDELKCWLGAMFWLILQFCKMRDNYKHPDGLYCPNLIDEKDTKFLRLAVGEKLTSLFSNEDCSDAQGYAKGMQHAPNILGFFKRFFWFNPQTDRVGGFALLLFPFDTSLFLPIAKKTGAGFYNGSLLRTLHTLVPLGFPASEISDVRTQCSYDVNSSYWHMNRKITYGVAGYATTNVRFAPDTQNAQCVHVVFTAFDNVVRIQSKEVIHRLPEHQRKTTVGVDTTIDRSLERFSFSPKLSTVDGKFLVIIDRATLDGKAGFDRPQVSNAVSAAKRDEELLPMVFSSHLKHYRSNNNETVAERKQRLANSVTEGDKNSKQDQNIVDAKQTNDAVAQSNDVVVDKKQDDAANVAKTQDTIVVDADQRNLATDAWDIVSPVKNSAAETDAIGQKTNGKRSPSPPSSISPKANLKKKAESTVKQQKQQETLKKSSKSVGSKKEAVSKPTQSKANSSVNQLQKDEEFARTLQRREFGNADIDDSDGFTQVTARKNRKPRAPPLIATPPTSPPSSSTVLAQQPIFSTSLPSTSLSTTISLPHTLSTSAAEASTADQTEVVAKPLTFTVDDFIASVVSANNSAQPILLDETVVDSTVHSSLVSSDASSLSVDSVATTSVAIVTDFSTSITSESAVPAQPLAALESLPTAAVEDLAKSSLPFVTPVGDDPVSTASTSSHAVSSSSTDVPTVIADPILSAAAAPVSAFASFYSLPSIFQIDRDALLRSYHTIRSHVGHVRHWIMMASRDRPFSHEKTVLIANRNSFEAKHVEGHLLKYTDSDDLRLLTPWAILSTAFDHAIETTPDGTPMRTLIINGGFSSVDESQFQILSSVGRFIQNSVVNAAYMAPTETIRDCSTCFMCRIAAPFRYCFIPQYIDANHTVCTRMVPLCVDDKCSLKLAQKVGDRSHEGGVAKFPGLRCFFNINGTITVCESEADSFKLTIGTSDSKTVEPSIRIVNGDFEQTLNSVFVTDQQGNVFALPQKVAEKAFYLAQFMLRTDL